MHKSPPAILRAVPAYLAALAVWLVPQDSLAATSTTTFQVQITIQAAFAINSATTLDFGTHGILTTNTDATSTITVQCTLLTPYNVGLNVGTGTGATAAARLMTSSASNTVTYSLYRDASRLLVWGETIGTDTVAGTGTGLAVGHTVYGRVPAQTTPTPALYTDTITVTVTF